MSTTEVWREMFPHTHIYVHVSDCWVLVELDGHWSLFGPGVHDVRMDPGDACPARNLLLASRAADAFIADNVVLRATLDREQGFGS